MISVFEILYCALVSEAFVYMLFSAAPLIRARRWVVLRTPWLFSTLKRTHALECPVCAGFYVVAVVYVLMSIFPALVVVWFFNLILTYRAFIIFKDVFSGVFNLVTDLIVWRSRK